jgi:beta-aspartyl-dipeptidase (metallo-type)
MLTLIEDVELYDPEPRGRTSLLLANDRIEVIGAVDRRALDTLGAEYETYDGSGCLAIPGLVDPHQHLLGGSGEGGLALQTPMLFPREIVRAGITTVVGTLGVDTTMKTIAGLLARVRALESEGVSAMMWTGGYNVPPTTVLGSVREDMLFIEEVVGAGELAISDERGLNQSAQELAKVVRDTHVGGLLSGKAGLTHFHVGDEPTRLQPLRDLIEEYQVKAEWLYPTHIQRNESLMREAIELAHEGSYVDFDTVEGDLASALTSYIENGGPLDKLTISSDADSGTPDTHVQQIRELVTRYGYSLDLVLPLATRNPATALKLKQKGKICVGADADVVLLERGSLRVSDVWSRGKHLVADGEPIFLEQFLEKSQRKIELHGKEA